MPVRRVLLCVVLACAGSRVLAAQGTTAAITAQDLRRRLFALADDSMGGRRSGSLGDFKAAEYVAREFQRLGLQPAGEGGTWFQTVPFFIAQPATTALTAGDATLTWGTDFVLAGRPLPLVQLHGAAVVYGGVVSDSTTWMPAGQAGGKVVVLDIRPGADGKRQLVRGLTRIATTPRFAGAAAVAVVEMDLLAPEVLYLIAGERLTADTSRGSGQPAIALMDAILAGDWDRAKQVADDLRRRFPHANLVVENRAIGGFASQLLVKTAETDLYPFYPDLVVFHVYGSHIEYENIIRRIRERTTAEILM